MSEEKKHDTSPAMDSAAHMVCDASGDERLKRQLDFILEIDKEKNILRQTHLSGHGRREDDAEHAWHMAVAAYLLREYSNERIDIGHVLIMCLIHDIVEIDAGDTYAYDYEAQKTVKERERKAADHLYGLLPGDQRQYLREIWEEFEAYETPESRFAHVLDNFQPFLLNAESDGKSWKEHGASDANIYTRNPKTAETAPEIWACMQEKIRSAIERGILVHEDKATGKK